LYFCRTRFVSPNSTVMRRFAPSREWRPSISPLTVRRTRASASKLARFAG